VPDESGGASKIAACAFAGNDQHLIAVSGFHDSDSMTLAWP